VLGMGFKMAYDVIATPARLFSVAAGG